MSTKEQLLQRDIIQGWITRPYSQETLNLASDGHESRRISDPYIFEIFDGKLLTPEGKNIDEIMEKRTQLDWNEYEAYEKITNWANTNENGTIIWISPSFSPTKYPVAKAVVSEIFTNPDGRKFLLNRNVVLDIGDRDVLDLANQLSQGRAIDNKEELRKSPIIPNYSPEYWQGILENYTDQVKQIRTGEDILIKDKTLRDSERIIERVSTRFGFVVYDAAYREAKEEGVIGKHQGSCSGTSKSPFSVFSENGNSQAGEKTLECTCPFCNARVTATISGGRIYCPNCGKSASYKC